MSLLNRPSFCYTHTVKSRITLSFTSREGQYDSSFYSMSVAMDFNATVTNIMT